ncbi:uncharacterized protein E0L32_002527 [Thyridium curvatum]|uniref:Uncharacterized protein n=1 Tax=Thyridium curvatum TaxID=1093900 RepID=A0A507BPJ0_9PEZI|nr:uncharacterized protein E0L32_002527 [Thyridium curvatum]TPX18670.1 hypothetical protein E0L32_002527 [Thyridium curvatum]
MDGQPADLNWSGTFAISRPNRDLKGDKILLPQSALEQLLAASPRVAAPTTHSFTAFDPFNPYSVAAAQRERSQYQETQQQLPHPLMFRVVNQSNGNAVYAGIREFSAQEGEVALSSYLLESLGIQESDFKAGDSEAMAIDLTSDDTNGEGPAPSGPQVTIHAKQLPKGTFVRLRPLEAGYNPDDWKSLLERQLRESFTTLTKGAIFSVRGVKAEAFRFLVDEFKPEGDGICVVDTDLEVDIEALNEEQARETLKQIMEKAQRAPGAAGGSSLGGKIDTWKAVEGQVIPGDYVDFELPSWDRSRSLSIELSGLDDSEDVDLFVSPKSSRQRALPRESEHVFSRFSPGKGGSLSINIQPTNIELENADSLLISVHGWQSQGSTSSDTSPRPFSLRVRTVLEDPMAQNEPATNGTHTQGGEDEVQCKNCLQWVPKRTLVLHENFCLRNNIACPHCKQVFQKRSPEWQDHWHCEFDDGGFGNTPSSKAKHDFIFHTEHACPSETCHGVVGPFPSLPDLARHRTSTCPGKVILCQFCHLEVPQEGDPTDPSVEAETVLTGLTPHERADGARTTDCHLCGAIVRLRDMAAHLKHHELDKQGRAKPEICRDELCGRTLHGVGPRGQVGAGTRMGQGPGNDLGLCSICFGPLYVSMHDPEGKALRRRIERRYLSQLLTGCGKRWCGNEWCKTGRANMGLEARAASGGTAAMLPLVKPLLAEVGDWTKAMHFCVDEGAQKRRKVAEMLAAEGGWEVEWCVAACEAEGASAEKAREWLVNWAPARRSM